MRLVLLTLALATTTEITYAVDEEECSSTHDESSCDASSHDVEEVSSSCTAYDPLGATVIYRDSRGRLGNWMSVYANLVALQIRLL